VELSVDEQRLKAVSDLLPEHHRRWDAGALASSLPHGGVKRVSQVLGISRKTVARGMREISQPGLIDAARVRRCRPIMWTACSRRRASGAGRWPRACPSRRWRSGTSSSGT